ncbi:hypothetical protein [Mucilaginibacter celer]|uniref:Uncharacterized protein n=1 Tax=Mucilaginibacter celer TaxID=2305508 RepID=A0A494VS86_9SPHI|nr:hypothetical protein [Mucilaginibacter celer]AYL94238.1 hypothetical protein HYN43_002540 [Mucilaginibacter celer]
MAKFLKTKEKEIESVKNIFETIALFIAAVWAILTFYIKDAPELKGTASTNSEMTIEAVDAKKVHINYFVTIKNKGKSEFEVDGPTMVRLWLIPIDSVIHEKHIEWEKYLKMPSIDTISSQALTSTYDPDGEINEGFDFFTNDDPNVAVLAAIDVNFKQKSHWYQFWKWFGKEESRPDYSFSTKMRCIPDKKDQK